MDLWKCRELIFMENLFFFFIYSMGLNWHIAEHFGTDPAELITTALIFSIWAVRSESLLTALLNQLAPNGLRLEEK